MEIFAAISHARVRQVSTLLQQDENACDRRWHDGKTPLIYAVCEAREETRAHFLRMLLRQDVNVNAVDDFGRTALMYASMDVEKIDLVRILSRYKACKVNVQDFEGNTAVIHAVMCGNSSAIKILVNSTSTKSSMNLELRNKNGQTALELAVRLQMAECCKVLVCEGGARTKKITNQGGLMRLLEAENDHSRTTTPLSRNPSRAAFMNRQRGSPIPENKQFEGSYMSRDTTPNLAEDLSERFTPFNTLSRSNSLHRSNSNLLKRRPEAGSRQSNTSPADFFTMFNNHKTLKRVLTPISGRNANTTPETPDSSIGRSRLPSIPSGRKLFLVSQNRHDDGV